MQTASPLKIVDFVNPRTGAISKRVTGTLPSGERIQKNFSGADALTLAQALVNLHAENQGANPPRPIITHLPETTVRAAEVAIARLPLGTDIGQAVDFFVEYRRPLKPIPLQKEEGEKGQPDKPGAIDLFGQWLLGQRKNEEDTVAQRKGVLSHFAAAARITHTDRLTVAAAQEWIYDPDLSPRTQRDRFDLLNQFCAYLVKRKLALANIVTELDRPVVRIDAPGVITFAQTWNLLMCALTDAEGSEMLPFFALCVLSGVRPEEVWRLGSELPEGKQTDGWEDIHLDDEHRIIEVNRAKGGRSRRNAEICDPLWRILTWCKARKLAANYFSVRKFNRIRRAAGLFDVWEKDLLRHTYASHHYILNKDIKTLTANMGNSEHVLFQNYIRPVPRSDGVLFFGLVLHYSTPRAQSVASMRIDRWLVKPPAELSLHVLRVVIMRLAGELQKLERNRGSQSLRADARTKLAGLRAELTLHLSSPEKANAAPVEPERRSLVG